MPKNPDWTVDELILALDLYLRHGQLDDRDPLVEELSEVLNRLPIHTDRPDAERFRNPNGVALKLANLARFDPEYHGVGMTRGSKRDEEVWDHFSGRTEELHQIADELRKAASSGEGMLLRSPVEDEDEVQEGRLLFRRHRLRERNPATVKRKKRKALAEHGRLQCEACGFDFAETYGELGDGYIECHHLRPLAETGPTSTSMSDLALLCANCHRMIHRDRTWPTVAQLRLKIDAASGATRGDGAAE